MSCWSPFCREDVTCEHPCLCDASVPRLCSRWMAIFCRLSYVAALSFVPQFNERPSACHTITRHMPVRRTTRYRRLIWSSRCLDTAMFPLRNQTYGFSSNAYSLACVCAHERAISREITPIVNVKSAKIAINGSLLCQQVTPCSK